MKLSDIRKLTPISKMKLENTVMNGKHLPEVEIYHDSATNKSYQVSEEHGLYRETPGSQNPYEVQEYGEWKKF
jgi:hypothetical protein